MRLININGMYIFNTDRRGARASVRVCVSVFMMFLSGFTHAYFMHAGLCCLVCVRVRRRAHWHAGLSPVPPPQPPPHPTTPVVQDGIGSICHLCRDPTAAVAPLTLLKPFSCCSATWWRDTEREGGRGRGGVGEGIPIGRRTERLANTRLINLGRWGGNGCCSNQPPNHLPPPSRSPSTPVGRCVKGAWPHLYIRRMMS